MSVKIENGASGWVDPDDAPELDDNFFDRAEVRQGDRIIRPGRPPLPSPKQAVNIRLSPEILAAFKADGPGWQTRINEALRDWLGSRKPSADRL